MRRLFSDAPTSSGFRLVDLAVGPYRTLALRSGASGGGQEPPSPPGSPPGPGSDPDAPPPIQEPPSPIRVPPDPGPPPMQLRAAPHAGRMDQLVG